MDKLLDLVLRTPLAKRYLAGFAERGIIIALGALAGWAGLPDSSDMSSDIAKFAAEVAPYVAAAVMVVIAQKRMKKAEVTIETSRVLPGHTSRPVIDATVKTLLKSPTPKADLDRAVADGTLHDLIQPVPPGTVDRTD
jgi:hypothetical protein